MGITKHVKNPRMVRAVLGMDYKEFVDLVPSFTKILYTAAKTRRGRKRAVGGGKKGILASPEAKLFFVLFYLKNYPTYDVQAFLFGKHLSRTWEDVHHLLPLLEKTLGHELVLPERQLRSVEEFLEKFPEVKDLFVDGTERRIQRPKNPKRNRRMYSGKKKTHTRKYVVATDEKKRILLLSPGKPGRRHDKRVLDGRLWCERIPPDVDLWGDSAFQGINQKHARVHVSKRATKKRPLTDDERAENHIIASFRVGAEHSLAGMKRFKVVLHVLRSRIGMFDELTARICAGLWNRHLRYAS